MVATRKSLPTSEPDDAETPATDEKKRKLSNALKKLAIDGLGPLKGENVEQKRAKGTYHWRGAVYEATELTAPEWIEQQPKRYQKRDRGVVAEAEEEKQQQQRGQAQKKAGAGRKRARSPDVEEEEAEEPPSQRPRRNADKYDVSYARPRHLQDFTPSGRKSKGRRRASTSAEETIDRMRTSRLFDFTRVGGHEALSCIEHARRRAAARGFEVEPMSRTVLARSKTLEKTVLTGLVKLARLNTQIEKISKDLEKPKALLAQYPELRGDAMTDSVEETGDVETTNTASSLAPARTTPHVFGSYAPRGYLYSQQPRHPPLASTFAQEPTPPPNLSPAPSTDVEIITERHDSGASLTPTHSASDDLSHPSRPTMRLPSTAKGGQNLRWSLPRKMTEVGRAEEAINKGRLQGESKSARRRRVKREFKLVQSWAVGGEEEEEEAGAGAEEGDEGVRTPRDEGEGSSPVDLEGRKDGSGGRKSSRVEKYKSTVCKNWLEGICRRGERCTYKHEMDS